MSKSLKAYILIFCLMVCSYCYSQPPQRMSYVDTEYILDQLPDFKAAQKEIDDASEKWKNEIRRKKTELEKLRQGYEAESVLLPEETRKKREEEIALKSKDLDEYKAMKFGPDGELLKKRQQLIKPIQDKVYKAVQDVALENAQDFIFDKSGAVTMLFSNPKYDRSDEVLEKLKLLAKAEAKEAKKKEMQSGAPSSIPGVQTKTPSINMQGPGGQMPGGQQPGGQMPGGQQPGGQMPGGQQPGGPPQTPPQPPTGH